MRKQSRGRVVALLIIAAAALVAWLWLLPMLRSWPHIPTVGVMSWGFGQPVSYQECGFHTGDDWFAPIGTPIYAIEAGEVIYVGPLWLDGDGVGRGPYSVVLYHENGNYWTTYGHNSAALVELGEQVERGQKIAEVGDLGYSPAPHLHLEKIVTPFTGDWQQPFVGCDSYVNPGDRWSPI